jgi:hypothetical protein
MQTSEVTASLESFSDILYSKLESKFDFFPIHVTSMMIMQTSEVKASLELFSETFYSKLEKHL